MTAAYVSTMVSRELSRLKMAHLLPSSLVPRVAWEDLHPSSTADWPWCYLRRDSNLFHQRWDGCDASCHSPSCDHPYCASEDQDQVIMSSHDSQSPPTWPPTNHVWPSTKLIQVHPWLITYWIWCWTLCIVVCMYGWMDGWWMIYRGLTVTSRRRLK